MSCRNFRKGKFHELRKLPKGKFEVNLNKGLCLLFRAEPQMKKPRGWNKDATKEQAPNQNILSLQVSVSVSVQVQVQVVTLSSGITTKLVCLFRFPFVDNLYL